MKTYTPSLLLFLMLMLFFNISKTEAQNGAPYIITQKNDTVYCRVKTMISGDKYLPADQQSFIKIKPEDIKEYKTNESENPMVSVVLSAGDKPQFMERLETGVITLYQLTKASYNYSMINTYGVNQHVGTITNSKVRWYAVKRGIDSVFLIKTNQLINIGTSKAQRKEAFASLIADNKQLSAKFDQMDSYEFDNIQQIIQDYNYLSAPPHDYLITLKRDTIKCFLKQKTSDISSPINFLYKTAGSDKFVPLYIDTLKEYRMNSQIFTSRKTPVDTSATFVIWKVRGKINLFEYDSPDYSTYFFISKNDGPLMFAPGSKGWKKKYLEEFYSLIADAPEVLERVKASDHINMDVLLAMAKAYNKPKP